MRINFKAFADSLVKRSKRSAYLQDYTFHDKSAHLHYDDRTVVYPLSQEMHVHQDAGGHFYISSFNGIGTQFQVLRYIIYVGNGIYNSPITMKMRTFVVKCVIL